MWGHPWAVQIKPWASGLPLGRPWPPLAQKLDGPTNLRIKAVSYLELIRPPERGWCFTVAPHQRREPNTMSVPYFPSQVPTTVTQRLPDNLGLAVTIEVPTVVIAGHYQSRDKLKIIVHVDRFGPRTLNEVVLVDATSVQVPAGNLAHPSRLFLYGYAYCASCASAPVSDRRRKCNPFAFRLPPDIEHLITLVSFDDNNTRFSQSATFKIPRRSRKSANGENFRCDRESLIIYFSLEDSLGNALVTYQVDKPFKERIHTSTQSQDHQPVQPAVLALPQAGPNVWSAMMTVPSPPPPSLPQIVDIIPRIGPHYASQRVWVRVQDLPRGDGLHYLINFGGAGTMRTSFVCSEGDQVQILECATPITSAARTVSPWLMQYHNPYTAIGLSSVDYTFA